MGNGHRAGNGPEINVLPGQIYGQNGLPGQNGYLRFFGQEEQCQFSLFWAIARSCPFSYQGIWFEYFLNFFLKKKKMKIFNYILVLHVKISTYRLVDDIL